MISMNFIERKKSFNKSAVKFFLEGLRAPCYESDVMKAAFGLENLSGEALELYQLHFLLFHELYKLQREYADRNQYLHIHFMRTYLLPYPSSRHCAYYHPEGHFCESETAETYCDFHKDQMGDNALEDVSIKYFYLDEKNYDSIGGEEAEDFIRGIWELMKSWDRVEKSRAILGLPTGFDRAMVKRKFIQLAKTFHPDVSRGIIPDREDDFIQLNNAYRFLMNLKGL